MFSRRNALKTGIATLALSACAPRFGGAQTSPTAVVETELGGAIPVYGPTIIVAPGEDARKKITKLPVGGPGGVIEFLPGDHTTSLGQISKRHTGPLLIRGVGGPNGERPRIRSRKADGKPFTFLTDTYKTNRPGCLLLMDGLEVYDGVHPVNVSALEGLLLNDCYFHHSNKSGQVWFSHIGGISNAEGKDLFGWCEVIGGEYSYMGGDGGLKHNFYISGPERVLVDGINAHSSRGHALKLVVTRAEVRNSSLRSSDIEPAILDAQEPIRQPYVSANLLDIAANASYIHGNTFKNYRRTARQLPPGGGTGRAPYMIDYRRRASLWGAEPPPYGSLENWTPATWEAFAKLGIDCICNPNLFIHFVADNLFEETSATETSTVVHHYGTRPVYPKIPDYTGFCQAALDAITAENGGVTLTRGSSDNQQKFAPLPPGWFERSHVWMAGNTYVGSVRHFGDRSGEDDGTGLIRVHEVVRLPEHPEFS